MVFGFYYLGTRLIRCLCIENPLPIHAAAGFIVTSSFIAAVVHLLALLGLANIWLLRLLACHGFLLLSVPLFARDIL